MEQRYWELRENMERAFDKWMGDNCTSAYVEYTEARDAFYVFCTEMLMQLMDENADVLKNLKNI